MPKSATNILALGLISLLAAAPAPAAQPAASQPAPARPAAWAQDPRETLCVYDGLLATEGGIETAQPARLDIVMAECRARFGWTEAQAHQGVGVTVVMIDAHNAQVAAVAAGVDPRILREIIESFTTEDILSLRNQGSDLTERGRRSAFLIGQRLAAHNLYGEQGNKAAAAIINRLLAARLGLEFANDLGRLRGN